jgi:hypothetical protein
MSAGGPGESPLSTAFSVEEQLVLACARTRVDAPVAARITALLREPLDWDVVLHKAWLQGTKAMLSHCLLSSFPDQVPEDVRRRLKAFLAEQSRSKLLQAMRLVEVVRLLESHGVSALPFKGPGLALYAYQNLALREFCDLDVLVRRRDVKKATALLTENGFRLVKSPSWFQRLPIPISRKKDLGLVSDDGRTFLELHWRLSGTHFDVPLNMENLWKRLDTTTLAGATLRSLPFDELILYLCVHGARHGWMRLGWICDIAELIRTFEGRDWGALTERARVLGSDRTLGLGLLLAHELLDAPLPPAIVERIRTDATQRSLVSQVQNVLFRDDALAKDISFWRDFHFHVKERWQDRLRLRLHYSYRYLRIAVVPNARDESLVHLPSALHFLYYFIRPIRLARERGLRSRKSVIKRLN